MLMAVISVAQLAILVIAVLQILRCRASDECGADLAILHDKPTKLVACLVTGAKQVLLIHYRAGNYPVRRRASRQDLGRCKTA